MKKYLILGFLWSAFALFGQKPIAIAFKDIGAKLNDSTLLNGTDNPECKALMATTKPLWDKLKKAYKTQDSIQDLNVVLSNLNAITSLVNASATKCLFKDSLTKYQDTLSKLYNQAYMNALDDTIVKPYIVDLKKQKSDAELANIGLKNNIQEKDKWITTLYYAIGGLVLVSLLALLIPLFLRKSKGKSEKTTKNTSNTEGFLDVKTMNEKFYAAPLGSNKEQATSPSDKEEQQKAKEEAAAALKKKEEEERTKEVALKKAEEEKAKAAAEAAKTIPAFYLSIPSGDGFFSNDNRIPSYRNGNTFYRFYLLSDTEAEFEFCSEATTFAIDQPETHIFRACDQLNTRPDKAKGIATETRGTARLEGDKWVITEKAKIKYLNS